MSTSPKSARCDAPACGASAPSSVGETGNSDVACTAAEQEQAARQSAVDHPPHYTRGGIETIDAIEAWGLGFHLGNAVKYISRAGHKGDALEDLKKARWYLDREIARRSK